MSSTDVSNLSAAVAGIQIDGPTTPTASGRIELNDENVLQVLPGEIDSAVGSVVQPEVEAVDDSPTYGELHAADITVDLDDPDYPEKLAKDIGKVFAAKGDALFDPAPFDVAPVLDGQATDELVIAVTGSVKFDATSDDGRELFEALNLGKFVVLRVTGRVASRQGQWKETSEGDPVVTGKSTVKIDSIVLRSVEDLG